MGSFKGSPSRQVKRNAAKIKSIIDSSQAFRSLDVRVEGIVVFTNSHASFHLNNPTVLVLKLSQLSNHISEHKGPNSFSRQQIEAMGKEIIRQKS
jgi:3-methyladenine DNA glycosylase Tag